MFDPPFVILPEDDEHGWVTDTNSARWSFQSRILPAGGSNRTGEFFRTLFGAGPKESAEKKILRSSVSRIVGYPSARSGPRVCIYASASVESGTRAFQLIGRPFFKSSKPVLPSDPSWSAFIASVAEAGTRIKQIERSASSVASTSGSGGDLVPAFQLVSQSDAVERIRPMLAENPSLVHERNKEEQTLLHRAAVEGNHQLAVFLLQNNAEVNAIDVDLLTPLHLARTLETVRVLVAAGADVNQKNKNGNTPLHSLKLTKRISSRKKQELMSFYFESCNPDPSISNNKGVTVTSLRAYCLPEEARASAKAGVDASKAAGTSATRPHSAVRAQHASSEEFKRQAAELTARKTDLASREAEVRRLNEELQAMRENTLDTSQKLRKVSVERDHLLQKQTVSELALSSGPRDEVIARLTSLNETLAKDLNERDERLLELFGEFEAATTEGETLKTERESLVETIQSMATENESLQSLRTELDAVREQNLQLSDNLGDALMASQAAQSKVSSYEQQMRKLALRSSTSPLADDAASSSSAASSSTAPLTSSGDATHHLESVVESLSELNNFQSILDHFLQNWQMPIGAIEISTQALAINRVLSLLQATCCIVSLDQLYGLRSKYSAALAKRKSENTVFGMDPFAVLTIVVSGINDKIFELETARIKQMDREQMLGLRAVWQNERNSYAISTFLPMLEHNFLSVLSNNLQTVEDTALLDAGRRRFFDFISDRGVVTAEPIINIVTAMIEWRARQLSPEPAAPVEPAPTAEPVHAVVAPAEPPVRPPPAPPSSSPLSVVSDRPPAPSTPVPVAPAAPSAGVPPPPAPPLAPAPPPPPPSAAPSSKTASKASGGDRGALLENIASFRFAGRDALRESMDGHRNAQRQVQAQLPAKVRIIGKDTITQLVEREALVRNLNNQGQDDDDDDDDDDWDIEDDDDDVSHSASDAAVWRKLSSEPVHTFGSFNPDELGVHETFLPLQVSNQISDEVSGFVLLKPGRTDPSVIEIFFFGVLTEALRKNAFVQSMAECTRVAQIGMSMANKLPAGAANFDMSAAQTGDNNLVVLEKKQSPPIEQISGPLQMQYAFILKNR